jgi:hypothetical protein
VTLNKTAKASTSGFSDRGLWLTPMYGHRDEDSLTRRARVRTRARVHMYVHKREYVNEYVHVC